MPTSEKTVKVRYFALLREESGLSQETIQTSAATLSDLYEELKVRHHLSLPAGRLRVAVNDSFTSFADPVKDASEIVFVPPVAGG
jgi:molybdopterin synthase sulfur carrier subunit